MAGKTFAVHPALISLFMAAGVFAAGAAFAQAMEVVTVEAVREIEIGRSATGAPLKEVSIRSKVSYADLDLTTDAGAKTLEKRIRDIAASSCKEIKVDFPAAGSTVEKCVTEATNGALAQANKVIADAKAAKK
jgi:UrcA family protein